MTEWQLIAFLAVYAVILGGGPGLGWVLSTLGTWLFRRRQGWRLAKAIKGATAHCEQQQEDVACRARRVADMLARFETTSIARVHSGLFAHIGTIRYHALATDRSIDDALDQLETSLGVRDSV